MRVRAVCTRGISDVGDVKSEIAFLRPLLHFKGFAQGLCGVCFKRLALCLPKNQEDVPVLYNITPATLLRLRYTHTHLSLTKQTEMFVHECIFFSS